MPTQAGIHDLRLLHADKAWMPTFVGMTGRTSELFGTWY
jgi:hypothetical protein